MIYLSGKLKLSHVGKRDDIGVIISYRPENPHSAGGIGMARLADTIWGGDNGCYTNPDIVVEKYLRWLAALTPYVATCLFATAPDVVGDALATWKRSEPVLPRIRDLGFPAALVAQDGMECRPVRWGSFDVLFIGGTTEWKLSKAAFELAREAKSHGLHVHMGRVNSRRRLRIAMLGLCDSADGTHFTFRPDLYHARMSSWLDQMRDQPFLDYQGDYMRTTHRLQVKAVCPTDDKADVYDCRIVTSRIIPVEDILAAVKALETGKMFQEALCEMLARELCCEVTLVGMHSGVKTEVVCGHFANEADADA